MAHGALLPIARTFRGIPAGSSGSTTFPRSRPRLQPCGNRPSREWPNRSGRPNCPKPISGRPRRSRCGSTFRCRSFRILSRHRLSAASRNRQNAAPAGSPRNSIESLHDPSKARKKGRYSECAKTSGSRRNAATDAKFPAPNRDGRTERPRRSKPDISLREAAAALANSARFLFAIARRGPQLQMRGLLGSVISKSRPPKAISQVYSIAPDVSI